MTAAVSLTIDELFTPAVSGVGGSPSLPPADGSWLASLLLIAARVQLPTTSWQPGDPERTILSLDAVALAEADAIISIIAQGGFLAFAASGVVTYVNVDGETVTQAVTPDPSDPTANPTGAPGWLDLLGQSVYDVKRLQATYATVPLAIVNTSASVAGPYSAGSYHVANTRTHATYSNLESLTIPSSAIAGTGGVVTGVTPGSTQSVVTTQSAHGLAIGDVVFMSGMQGVVGLNSVFAQVIAITTTTFTVAVSSSGTWTSGGTVYQCTIATVIADVRGTGSNAGPGDITTTVTQANGVGCFNVLAGAAANYETNVDYATRCQLKLAALSPNGPSDAYVYFAKSAQDLLAEETPPVALTNGPIVKALNYSDPVTGVVITVVASSTPASNILSEPVTPGCAQLPITGVTNASPIEISTGTAHGLRTGDIASISGVLGTTNANTTTTVVVTSNTTFTLDGTSGNGAYTGGGVVEGGDLGQIDQLLQENVVPDGTISVTQSALAFPVAISATVVVPQAFVGVYRAAVNAALSKYLASIDLGGVIIPPATTGVLSHAETLAALSDIGVQVLGGTSYVRTIIGLTINGSTTDIPFASPNSQAILGVVAVNVVGT